MWITPTLLRRRKRGGNPRSRRAFVERPCFDAFANKFVIFPQLLVIRTINVGSNPAPIAVSSTRLYVANAGDDTVTVVQLGAI